MKKTILWLSLILLWIGCKNEKQNSARPTDQPKVNVSNIDNLGQNFERLPELLPAPEYSHSYDSLTKVYISWGTYSDTQDSTSSAGVVLSNWNLQGRKPELMWEYRDTFRCNKASASIKPELDSIYMVYLAGSEVKSPAIAYLTNCNGDNEETKLNLIVLNSEGQLKTHLYGRPLSYVPTGGVDSMEVQYKGTMGRGKHAEGRIENYFEFDNYAPSDRKLFERLWRSALKHKLGIKETVPEAPAQDSVKKS